MNFIEVHKYKETFVVTRFISSYPRDISIFPTRYKIFSIVLDTLVPWRNAFLHSISLCILCNSRIIRMSCELTYKFIENVALTTVNWIVQSDAHSQRLLQRPATPISENHITDANLLQFEKDHEKRLREECERHYCTIEDLAKSGACDIRHIK